MFRASILVVITLLAGQNQAANVLTMDFTEDSITLTASNASLHTLLQQIADTGVDVRIDPSLTRSVSATFTNMASEKALKAIISPLNYTVRWDVMRGPLGKWPVLASVHVFKPGKVERAKKLTKAQHIASSKRNNTRTIRVKFVKDEILLRLNSTASLSDFKALLKTLHATPIDSLESQGLYRLKLEPGNNVLDAVDDLKNNPLVDHAEPNLIYEPSQPLVSRTETPTNIATAPNGVNKNGMPVAVLDTGLTPESHISGSVIASLNAPMPSLALTDSDGHGTHMAYLASGYISPIGVDPQTGALNAPIVAIKAFDDDGHASSYELMQSIDFGLSNGARVFSLSWGAEYPSEFMANTMTYAHNNGAIVVAAAGNTPTGHPLYPAAYPNVVAVSALDREGTRWEDSNYGDFVDISAAGFARMPTTDDDQPSGTFGGTSIATAFVANNLSRYWATRPDENPETVLTGFQKSLSDQGSAGRDPYYGEGSLDQDALNRLFSP